MKIAALAGGVGGARLADGLAQCLPGGDSLTVVVNTGDDFDHLGLRICPDLDTVMYTLAGLANLAAGWGLEGETWNALDMLERYGAETWFKLGDRDLAVHIYRTCLLQQGECLTQVTETLCQALGVDTRVLPMSDEPVATMVQTDEGELAFQEYFVRRAWQPVLRSVRFEGIERARATPEVIGALEAASLVVLCPSNPFVSLDPILALPGLRERLRTRPVVAVSPIIGGQAVKGPAAKMFRELGLDPSPLSVARHYADILSGLVIDKADAALQADIEAMGIRVLVTDALMRDRPDRARLAGELLKWIWV
ncbi:MAG: 2-phospho-L-lactate transferase [Thermoflexales bacterium]|nr:2-phospho-L-lactate transferase [Thermoflexales bacterium]